MALRGRGKTTIRAAHDKMRLSFLRPFGISQERNMAKSSEAFAVGDRVQHGQYGLGKVVEVSAPYTTIEFDEAGRKKFVTELMRLTKSDAPAVAKPSRSRAKAAKKA